VEKVDVPQVGGGKRTFEPAARHRFEEVLEQEGGIKFHTKGGRKKKVARYVNCYPHEKTCKSRTHAAGGPACPEKSGRYLSGVKGKKNTERKVPFETPRLQETFERREKPSTNRVQRIRM